MNLCRAAEKYMNPAGTLRPEKGGTGGFDIGEPEYASAVRDHKVPPEISPWIRRGNGIGYRSFPYRNSGTIFRNCSRTRLKNHAGTFSVFSPDFCSGFRSGMGTKKGAGRSRTPFGYIKQRKHSYSSMPLKFARSATTSPISDGV